MAAQILNFVCRQHQLDLRGRRNYSRWMLKMKGYVSQDSPKAAQWRDEALLELKADKDWAKRHGPVAGGAWIAGFPWREPSVERPQAKQRRSSKR